MSPPTHSSPLSALHPVPHRLRPSEGVWTPPPPGATLRVSWPDGTRDGVAATRLAAVAGERRWRLEGASPDGAHLRLERDGSTEREAYALRVTPAGVVLRAGHAAGLGHAASTLAQLLRGSGDGPVPALEIEDAPDFAVRGALLDLSRDRVPTMESLEWTIDRLAEAKVNHLELYFEHTFAYPGHEDVWRDASPLLPDEVRRLARFAAARGVELVPAIQVFGHMHRWLKHPRYAPLAERAAGIEHAFAFDREPFGLCPLDPGSLALARDLIEAWVDALPAGRDLNVGMDETLDLGMGRSRRACRERGKGRIYLEHLRAVERLVASRGRRALFWGDVILGYPDLVPELPRSAVALLWGYEATHPFEEQCAAFAASGLTYRVCPGTSTWQGMLGRLENARTNVERAVRAARAHGAEGIVTTDWGDFGHWQPAPVAWPGLVLAAARSWNAAREPDSLARALDVHWLRDAAGVAGGVLLDLARLVDVAGGRAINGAPWFFFLRYVAKRFPPTVHVPEIDAQGLARVRERGGEVLARLADARLPATDGGLVARELAWAVDLAATGSELGRARCAAGPDLAAVPRAERLRLAAGVRTSAEELRGLWGARSRPGGCADSCAKLERVAAELER